MKNIEKAKFLRETRKRLGMGQEAFAAALGLNASYISQFENARRSIDDWYVAKARELAERVEKSKVVKDAAGTLREGVSPYHVQPVAQECHEHLSRFIVSAQGDPARLGWILTELRERFPLGKWAAGEDEIAAIAKAGAEVPFAELELKRRAASTTGSSASPGAPAVRRSDARPGAPDRAPKKHAA